MINEFNINIFNYIFSINEDIKEGIKKEQQEYKQELNKIINEICELQDFWNEHKEYFNDKCVFIINGTNGVKYDNFPRMKLYTKNFFLDYKAKQIKETICNNGDLIKEELEKIFINIENLGRKVILDYCKNKGLIQYNGKVFIEADVHPAYAIRYDNIKAILYNNDEQNGIFSQNIIQNINYGNNYGTLNQTNNFQNDDERLFEIILEKLNAMQVENNLPTEKIEEMKEACNKKEKSKVIKFLKEIAMGTGTNLIASRILEMFGLM